MPNTVQVIAHLQALADFPGIEGCALVETATGMAWHVAGSYPELERIGEAAIEFWRVQERLTAHLNTLGTLNSAAYSFSNRVVALFPCNVEAGLVLVCVAAKGNIGWQDWGVKVEALRRVVAQSLLAAPSH
jgi:hypothetical protein